jgi:hypothetical protein
LICGNRTSQTGSSIATCGETKNAFQRSRNLHKAYQPSRIKEQRLWWCSNERRALDRIQQWTVFFVPKPDSLSSEQFHFEQVNRNRKVQLKTPIINLAFEINAK